MIMMKNKFFILSALVASTSIFTVEAMEAVSGQLPEYSSECKLASAAASIVYDITGDIDTDFLIAEENNPLHGYVELNRRLASEGSIQAVTLYNAKTNVALISYQGTKSTQDWLANFGIGCSIAQSIHSSKITINLAPVRLPDYFSGLATRKLQGLLGGQITLTDLKEFDGGLSGLIDTCVGGYAGWQKVGQSLKNTGTYFVGGVGTFCPLGAVTGTVIPGIGTAVGTIGGGIIGLCSGIGGTIYEVGALSKEMYRLVKDKDYERELHLNALLSTVDLRYIDTYTRDSSDFLKDSVKKIFDICDSDNKPNILVGGHSLGRFLSGSAFLDYLGAQAVEDSIVIDGLQSYKNIGFNGPAGFQGLPHLPFMTGQTAQTNITNALALLNNNSGNGPMIHVRRTNDLVGNLGHDLDFSSIQEINDVVNQEQVTPKVHFLNNHSIKLLTKELHQ